MHRRLFVLLVLISLSVAGAVAAADDAATRPNILFILADDQRWDTIGALGNAEIRTPHLDRLVERGFHFNNAYCMGGMISAVCWPSRTMLITGRSLWHIPQDTNLRTPPPGVPLLPTLLAEAGYVTFHSGKKSAACAFGNAAFDTNLELEGRTADTATMHADQVIEFLGRHDGQRPFFIYLAPVVPHDPRLAPERFRSLYAADKLTLSKNFMPMHPFDNGALWGRDERLAPHPRTADVMRQHLADYYSSVSHLDHEVGRVLDEVARRGWADNTVTIYSSDQGLAVGGRHGLMGKQNLYEHVKPPLVIAGPGIAHGESDALLYLFDLFPTICELSGVTPPKVIEGRSLLPIIEGRTTKIRDWLFCAYIDCQRMVRDARWKLIQYRAAGQRHTQLFDLQADPDELHNLAGEKPFANEQARLEALMRQARRQFDDPVDFDSAKP